MCVFAGSSSGTRPAYAEAARALGAALARRGVDVVYGGASRGLMGEVADAALAGGGRVYGVITEALLGREVGHEGLTELHVVTTMHERKAAMAEASDAFVALPGGLGTLEELMEIATWAQLGVHAKPVGILDANGFYGPLLAALDHAVEEGFLRREHRALLVAAPDPDTLLTTLARHEPPHTEKWIDDVRKT